jgi:hopanoid biosynthesis associated protein HpnK
VALPPLLILTADDFGSSHRGNAAILQAHRGGVLAAASLMVAGAAAAEAVAMARAHPALRVGLHLVLVDGASALGSARAPHLVDRDSRFPASPLAAGLRYGLRPGVRDELAGEIRAQFERFAATGLPLDHVNGHHHLHMHPAVWPLVVAEAERRGAAGVRVTREDLRMALRWDRRGVAVRAAHAAALAGLARRCRRGLAGRRLRRVDRVYGVLQVGEMTEAYLLWLLEAIPPADAEILFHPGAERGAMRDGGPDLETQALASPVVRAAIAARGFRTGGYTDLGARPAEI